MRTEDEQLIVDNFWERVYTVCKSKHINISELCEHIGLVRTYISSAKSRGRSLTIERAVSIAKYLNVSLDYLLTGEKTFPSNNPYSISLPVRIYKDPTLLHLVLKNLILVL